MTEDSGEDRGLVSAVNGNQITVELIRGGGCKSCTMQGLCFRKSTPAIFTLKSDISLQVGDSVQLEISAGGRTLASLLIFGLPLLLLFTGFLLASQWLVEPAAVAIGFASMASSMVLLRWLDKKIVGNLDIRIAGKL